MLILTQRKPQEKSLFGLTSGVRTACDLGVGRTDTHTDCGVGRQCCATD